MVSERMRRQFERLLDEAEAAVSEGAWQAVVEKARAALAIEPDNADAQTFLAMGVANGSGASAATEPPNESAARRPSAEPASFAGGRYEVLRFLGEGGKKKVYLAHDSLLDRDVAFALIKTEGLDEASRTRVSREAQAMGRLGAHPHIVTVFDLGESDGQPYMVTELMGGGDVEGLIEHAPEHRVPLDQALRIASEVCAGLKFAHARGIVHRDLKPGNVWLTSDGVAKIGDFGLAIAVDRSRLTQAGMMVGTVSYMPPEQATGGEVTARSDLYSLGAMLYELVCGRPPFVGDENVAIIGQHLNTPPVAPSWHRKDLPQVLETLILRLLAKDPSQRPGSASEVREAIERVDLRSTPGPSTAEAPAGAEDPVYRQTFVGREAELRQLQSAFDAALSGQGALAMVVGEPGIGKTALCEQLATYAAIRGSRVLHGNCYEEGSLSLPYLAFIEALRTYVLARDPEDLRSELGTSAGYVARIVSEIRDRVEVQLPEAGDPEDDRWRLLQSVTAFLRNASEVQPLLLVLEDLHWSDRGTLDLLQHLARNLSGARMLVVGTYRDVEVDRTHPLSSALAELRRIGSFSSVRLRGLGAEDVHTMLERIAQRTVPWGVAEQVHRQTEGHPLFVQEVMRYLVEEGVLARDEGGRLQRLGETPLVAQIPEGLRDVIGKRISRLSAECNRVLAVAAVIGRDFDFQTLIAVAALPEDAILAALEEAVRVGVIQEQTVAGGVRYRFAHAFFRQTLYEEQIAPRRLRLHQEVARAIEAQHARRLDDHAAELAEHFSYSTDPADLAKAVQYAERAAERALAVFDYGESARLLEKALGVQEVLDPGDKAKRCDLLLALGIALRSAGDPRQAADEAATQAFALAEALPDSDRTAAACQLALQALAQWGGPTVGAMADYRSWSERANHYARPDTLVRVVADHALGTIALVEGRFAEARMHCTDALQAGRRVGSTRALWTGAWAVLGIPPSPGAFQLHLELAREFADLSVEGLPGRDVRGVLLACVTRLLSAGERDKAEQAARRYAELAERTREPAHLLAQLRIENALAICDGRLEDAVASARGLIARGDELGSPVGARQNAESAGVDALRLLGRHDEALQLIGIAAISAGVSDTLGARSARPAALAAAGRTEEARLLLSEFHGELQASGQLSAAPVQALTRLLTAALALDQLEAAKDLAAALEPARAFADIPVPITLVARLLGNAAAALGKPAEARTYYLEALDLGARMRHRPETALTRLGLAELLLEHYPAEQAEAQEHLDFAIEEFREMKMQPSLERALRHKGLLKA